MALRKAVDDFDRALAGPASGGPAQSQAVALAAVAHRIAAVSDAMPGIDEDFRLALRERLVQATVAQAAAAVPPQRAGRHAGSRSAAARAASSRTANSKTTVAKAPNSKALGSKTTGSRVGGRAGSADQGSLWRRRLLAAGIGVAVATGSVGGIAIASANALPGDPLYNTKKMFENLQLSMSGSPTDQGRQYLKLADTRLAEIDDLLTRGDVDVPGSPTGQYLAQTLNELQSMIASGGQLLLGQVQADDDQTAVRALSDFLLTERQRVLDLSWQLPITLQGRPAQIVALMGDLTRQLEQDQSQFVADHPGGGQSSAGGSHRSTPQTGAPSGSAAGTPNPTGSGSPSTTTSGTPGASTGATPSSTADATPTIGINLPLPILPSTGLDLPPLLPGLPGIDLGLGEPTDPPTE
jgi:Domain of unknown function (DUF5667)